MRWVGRCGECQTWGSVVEAGATTPGTPTATGTLTDTDVDNPPNTFTAVCTPKASTGGYGTFTMTANGVWAYTIDQSNGVVQALNVGDTLTDSFTVTSIDGTAQLVTITLNGANDAAAVVGDTVVAAKATSFFGGIVAHGAPVRHQRHHRPRPVRHGHGRRHDHRRGQLHPVGGRWRGIAHVPEGRSEPGAPVVGAPAWPSAEITE